MRKALNAKRTVCFYLVIALILGAIVLTLSGIGTTSAHAMTVSVKSVYGTVYSISAESGDSVDNLKAKIEDQTGILPKNQTLIYAGKQLESGKTLSDYNITSDANITFVTSFNNIEIDNNIIKGDVFYYGTYTSGETDYDVPWIAMDNNGYAFSKYLLGKSTFNSEVGTYMYANDKDGNDRDSTLKTLMDGFYNGDNTLFTDSERTAIKQTTLTAESLDESKGRGRKDINAYVFPMSAWCNYDSGTDTYTYYGDFNTINSNTILQQYLTASQITDKDGECEAYWFRTAMRSGYNQDNVFCPDFYAYVYVDAWELTNGTSVGWSDGVRPAFTLDKTKILFKSAAADGKVSGTSKNALTAVEKYSASSGREWKLTLLDSDRNFTASVETTSVGLGNPVFVKYSGAKTGDNEYISAMLLDVDGNLLYYGQAEQSQESGTAKVYLPTSLESGKEYTLHVFNEQANGDYKTDYSSAFVDFTITTYTDTTAPNGIIEIDGNPRDTFSEDIDSISDYIGYPYVTIIASDDSDDVKIEYFIAEKCYTKAELETTEFLTYTNTFMINKDMQQVIVYARLTDNASHVTYLCTNMYCIDTTAPTISGIENNKTYCGKVAVTVSDTNLTNVKLNGTNLELNNNTEITFDVSPSTGTQTIYAEDMAGNETTYTITVNDGHTAGADDGDCTTDIYCEYCNQVLTEGYESHDYIEDTSYTGEEKKYICSRSGCSASKFAYTITFEDQNITTDKTLAEIGESVNVGYNRGYNVTWSVKNSSGEDITYTTNENDETITFTMPSSNVVISATATLKQFNVVYNYINNANEPVSEYKTVNYNDNLVLYSAPTYSYNGYDFEFCCWRVSYTGTDYTLTTVEQTNESGGKDTVFKVDFINDSLTYNIYSHYMTGIESSFIVSEPYAEEIPSYDVYEETNGIYVSSADVSWYIGEYDDSKDFPSNGEDLPVMGQSQTFVENQTYTVFFWVSLHNEYVTVKKATEDGSLGYVNPIINGVESKWLSIYNNYIMTYYTFTAKEARTSLGIASGAAFYDENGYKINGETSGGYTNIKASVGDKLYLVLTQSPDDGYEFDAWEVNVGDVVVQEDEHGYYIIVNENTTVIKPTFKTIQYTMTINILGEITEQTIDYDTSYNLVADESLPDGRVFYCWLYESANNKYIYSWGYDIDIIINCDCSITACYGIPVTPEYYIPTPVVGETPSYEVHAKYDGTLCNENVFELSSSTYAAWYYYSEDESEYLEMSATDTFISETEYVLYIWINFSTSGYAFESDDSGDFVYPILNGKDMDYEGQSKGYEKYSYTFLSPANENYEISATNGAVLVNTFTATHATEKDSVVVTANDIAGKSFSGWQVSGIDTTNLDLTKAKLTFTMPANAVTVEATYALIDYAITVTNGTVTSETANYGDSVTVTASAPEDGREFYGWQDENGNIVSTDESYTFTVTDSVNLTAVYKDKPTEPDPTDPTDTDPLVPEPAIKNGLSGGAIAGIAVGSTAVAGIGGFSIFWFAIKKKSWAQLMTAIKGIFIRK